MADCGPSSYAAMERSVPSKRCFQRLVCSEVTARSLHFGVTMTKDDFFWHRYSEITFLSLVPPAALEDIILRSSYTELLAGLNSELCSARVASVCLRLRVRGANRLRKPCCRRTFAIGGAVAGALL